MTQTQSTDQLSREVQDTRDSLAHDLDALQDRVSPGAIVERRKAAVRGRASSVKSRVMGTAQSAKGDAKEGWENVKDKAADVISSIKDKLDGDK